MASVQTWKKTRTPNVYVRPSKTSPTGKLWKAYYPGPVDPTTGKPRQQTRTFPREREATEFLEQVHHRKVTGTLFNSKAGRRPLRELYDEVHEARRYASATVELHRELWKKLEQLADVPVADIDPVMVDRVLGTVQKPAMCDKARGLLSTLFNYAIDKKLVHQNPAKKAVHKPTRQEQIERNGTKKNGKQYLKRDELVRLLAELPDRYRVLVALMSSMGLRPGEAYALKVGKFDPDARTLVIDESADGSTKTGESRTLVLPSVIADILADHIDRFSSPKDPRVLVFPSPTGTMIQDGNFRNRVFYPARDRAGIGGDLTPNSCRHTAVAFAIGTGANVYDVQKMVGHAKPSITLDVYGDLWEGSQERLAARQDVALREQWGDQAFALIGSVTAELPA